MSEHPEQGEQSAPAAPMPETAEPSQETPTIVGSASPAFACADDEARRPDADPSDPGVPASTPPEAAEAAPAAPAAEEVEPPAPEATQPVEANLEAVKAEAELAQEVEKLRASVEKMQGDAAERVQNHRMQILNDLGIRKDEYAALAPEGDPATDEGQKAIRDWALDNPGLFKPSPALPTEKEQGQPQLGLLTRTRKTWRDAFGS